MLLYYVWCVYLFLGYLLYEKLVYLLNNLVGVGNFFCISIDNVNLIKLFIECGC